MTVRAADGRSLIPAGGQGEILNAVNSILVNGYLTTAGWTFDDRTRELIERSEFEVEGQAPAAG